MNQEIFYTDMQAIISNAITPPASVEAMGYGITHALHSAGVFTRLLSNHRNFPVDDLHKALVLHMRDQARPMFMLSINGNSFYTLGQKEDGTKQILNDAWPFFPVVSMMIDHPATPRHLKKFDYAPENGIVTTIDEEHLDVLEDAGIACRTRLFCPHGGPTAIPDPMPAKERLIDALFVGNVQQVEERNAWLEAHAQGEPDRRKALAEALECVSEGESPVYRALKESFERYGLENTPFAVSAYVEDMLMYLHYSQRLESLKAIKNLKVKVLGRIDPAVRSQIDHHDLCGETPFFHACSLMAKSKILLNFCSVFPHGAHERVFYGLSRGAVIVTDNSTFLREDFERGLGMVAAPRKKEDLNILIPDLLASSDTLDRLRAQGMETYPKRHTWHERMGRILPAVKKHMEPHRSFYKDL